VTDQRHVAVPVGISAQRWMTVTPARTVLMVAHNVTTVTRLLDVLTAFDNDSRIQLVFTQIGADPFQHGLSETIDNTGMITIPWEQAVNTRFDLAISASHHGELADISAPLIILSHGIGYTKYSPRKPETGNRKPETGNRKPETDRSLVFRRSGFSTTVSLSPVLSCCHTRNSWPDCGTRPLPRRPSRSSPAIPASTGSW